MIRFPAQGATGGAYQEGSMGQLVRLLRCFRNDDTGAVTIDWVALTSGILLLGIMVVYAIFNLGVSSLADNVNTTLATIITDNDVGAAPVGSGERNGNASDQACETTDEEIVCMGPQ